MKQILIFNWVVNLLVFSLPFSWYMCYRMYKDMKDKDHIIKIQDKMLRDNGVVR